MESHSFSLMNISFSVLGAGVVVFVGFETYTAHCVLKNFPHYMYDGELFTSSNQFLQGHSYPSFCLNMIIG